MKIRFSLICIHQLLNHRLRKTRGPLRLGEYIFTCLKHQYEQQRKDLWIKSNFKLVHFGMPNVSVNMEATLGISQRRSNTFVERFCYHKNKLIINVYHPVLLILHSKPSVQLPKLVI